MIYVKNVYPVTVRFLQILTVVIFCHLILPWFFGPPVDQNFSSILIMWSVYVKHVVSGVKLLQSLAQAILLYGED